ncbi:heterokaryon incompatibility protein-domain-containing protein [Podospora didyma]|uniref:Heterokaryon incompatibility protein-domain-containing protein n=1 Tax=Podospora didyma TaxID=330526 RepID=A0AAE0NUP7_9PEZI|nr:heterokaryon incompatibility protein-domain-containing protein [Podospora didyma]
MGASQSSLPANQYQYKPLENSDIRLITILPAKSIEDNILIRIAHVTLLAPQQHEPTSGMSFRDVAKDLPPGWIVREALDGRLVFYNPTPNRGEESRWTWVSPPTFTTWPQPCRPYSDHKYEALSYVWGSSPRKTAIAYVTTDSSATPDQSTTILAELIIRPNLADAIRHLRYQDRERTIWIDAISINQSDVAERDEQVTRMSDIYRLAYRVVVWLGPRTQDSKHALNTLEYLGKQVVISTDNFRMPAPDAAEPTWYSPKERLPYDPKTWRAIGKLFSRDWFERLWVIQEIKLARDAIVCCGSDQVKWSCIRNGIFTLFAKEDTNPHVSRIRLELTNRLFWPANVNNPISFVIINAFTSIKCQDKRDRIYGFLGLFYPDFRSKIDPDYRSPAEHVFRDFVVAHIKHFQRLELLCACFLQPATPGTPSWVPEFSGPAEASFRLLGYFAAGYSCSWFEFDAPNILRVTGRECTTVTRLTRPIEGKDERTLVETIRRFEPSDLDTAQPYITGESFRTAYAKSLAHNWLQERYPDRTSYQTEERWASQDSAKALFGEHAKTPLGKGILLSAIERRTVASIRNRPYMVTKEGYIGFGPPAAKLGDIVCILLGCSHPMLLRPQLDNKYLVVGSCFIYGLHDAIGLLGPLPSPWRAQVFKDSIGLRSVHRFFNPDTNTLSDEDPRLEPLDESWERVADVQRTGNDPYLFQRFKNKLTGEVINSDPRLTPEALKARGVDLKEFSLI